MFIFVQERVFMNIFQFKKFFQRWARSLRHKEHLDVVEWKCIKTRIENYAVNLYNIGYLQTFHIQISASVTLVYNVRIGSEGLVEDNLNSARPKALGCNLPAMHTENFHTFEPILVHFAPLNYRKEGTKESWVGNLCGISRWFSFTVLWART